MPASREKLLNSQFDQKSIGIAAIKCLIDTRD
jgi:hypothetical protein